LGFKHLQDPANLARKNSTSATNAGRKGANRLIISASYKTDIPAFYGEWFLRRLRAGYCKMINPYGRQIYQVSLLPQDVDGFVFWTRNAGPFLPALRVVRENGFPFVVQYTITGYPRSLEASVAPAARTVDHIRQIAGEHGSRAAVWRYDPILFTSLTPPDFHRRNFAALARQLEGATDEVVISFAQVYRKTERNLNRAAEALDFTWEDPDGEGKLSLARDLVAIAAAHGMRLVTCSQNQYLVPGARPARCVDADRLSDVAGRPIAVPRKGNRPDCECSQSRDIGDYDSCPHGCVYCYAVSDREQAQERFWRHDPAGEFLVPPPEREAAADPQTAPRPLA
jgi:hypothetical protein